jgi:dCTP deaminase
VRYQRRSEENEMSTLGCNEIIRRMQAGDLSVAPLLSDDQIGAASVDLRIGNVVLIIRARGLSHVDPAAAKPSKHTSDHARESRAQQKHERFELPFESQFLLHPGGLALVPTLEWVSLPPDLIGVVTARSTWAREGLSIATATLIEPSYQGIVTLELANMGEIPIALYPGLEIAQIAFNEVIGDTARFKKSQFNLSFEPRQGTIAKESEYVFLPDPPEPISGCRDETASNVDLAGSGRK